MTNHKAASDSEEDDEEERDEEMEQETLNLLAVSKKQDGSAVDTDNPWLLGGKKKGVAINGGEGIYFCHFDLVFFNLVSLLPCFCVCVLTVMT